MPTTSVLQVSPLSFEQNNPWLAGFNSMQKGLQGQAQTGLLQQQIQSAQYANQMDRAKAQYAQPMALAGLLQAQAQPNLTQSQAAEQRALAGLHGTQAQLAQKGLPYAGGSAEAEMKQKQNTIYTDPTINRIAQASNAQNAGLGDTLRAYGILPGTPLPTGLPPPGSPASQLPVMPVNSQGVNAAIQGAQNNPALMVPHPLSGVQNSPGINGLTAPSVAGSNNTAENWARYGTTLAPGQGAGLEELAKKNVDDYQAGMKDANERANKAIELTRDLDSFKDAYDKATLKGPSKGMLPSKGYLTALYPGDLSPEQTLDSLGSKMIAGLRSEAVGGRVTNDQVKNWLSQMKPGRAMEQGAVTNISNILGSSADREKEEPAFISTAVNAGIPYQTAKSLFNKYDQERPPYDAKTMKPIPENSGSWTPYISQEALNALSGQKPFMPNVPSGGLVSVLAPNGKTLRLPLEGAERLVKDHPDHKRIA